MSAREVYLSLPFVDRETGNWSLTRTGASIALACWCTRTHAGFNWASVAVLAIIAVMFLAKSMGDLSTGFKAVGSIFRRRSTDSRPAIQGYEDTRQSGMV